MQATLADLSSAKGVDLTLVYLVYEALSQLDDKEREVVQTVIAGILHMHDAKRWTQATDSIPAVKAKAKTRKAGGR